MGTHVANFSHGIFVREFYYKGVKNYHIYVKIGLFHFYVGATRIYPLHRTYIFEGNFLYKSVNACCTCIYLCATSWTDIYARSNKDLLFYIGNFARECQNSTPTISKKGNLCSQTIYHAKVHLLVTISYE